MISCLKDVPLVQSRNGCKRMVANRARMVYRKMTRDTRQFGPER